MITTKRLQLKSKKLIIKCEKELITNTKLFYKIIIDVKYYTQKKSDTNSKIIKYWRFCYWQIIINIKKKKKVNFWINSSCQ